MWWGGGALRIRWRATALLVVGSWAPVPLNHALGQWWIGAGAIVDPAGLPWPVQADGGALVLAVPQGVFPPGLEFAVQAVGDAGASAAYRLRTQ